MVLVFACLSIMPLRFIHVVMDSKISFLWLNYIQLYKKLIFFNPLIHQWIFKLPPCLGYYK